MLGVGPSADPDTLRSAYRVLARKHHPDVSSAPDAHERMARINEAFETLIDPGKRIEYDAMMAGGGLEGAPIETERAPDKPVIVRLICRLSGHKTPVYAVTFCPDTSQPISSAFDNEIIWWDEATQRISRTTKLESGTVSVLRAFANRKLCAAGASESQLSFWRLNDGEVEAWRVGHEEWVSCVAISADGDGIASGSLYHTLALNRTSDGANLYRKSEHAEAVTAVAYSADGRYVATGSADASAKLWHSETGALLHTFQQIRSTVTAIAFSHDNRYVAVAAVDLSIRVFSLSDGKLVKMMFGHTKPIESLEFHPNNWLFASGSRDGTLGLWNAAKGIGNVRIEASSRPITCVAFSSDGTRLASCGQDKIVRLWEVAAKESA